MNCDDGGDCALLLNVISTGCPLTHVRHGLLVSSLSLGWPKGKAIDEKEMSYLLAYGWRMNINSIKADGYPLRPGRDNRRGGLDAIVDICRCKQICRQCDRITFSSRGGRLTSSCSLLCWNFPMFLLGAELLQFLVLLPCQMKKAKQNKTKKGER